jgi:hypothetical protein
MDLFGALMPSPSRPDRSDAKSAQTISRFAGAASGWFCELVTFWSICKELVHLKVFRAKRNRLSKFVSRSHDAVIRAPRWRRSSPTFPDRSESERSYERAGCWLLSSYDRGASRPAVVVC